MQPLNDEDWAWYTEQVDEIAKAYPIDQSAVAAGDFKKWADEGLELAETMVYPGYQNHEVPSEEYLESRKPVLEKRMMMGAARLAFLISDIYTSSKVDQVTQ